MRCRERRALRGLIRREAAGDAAAIDRVHELAFGGRVEPDLVHALRADAAWIPALALVADDGDNIVGHVVCTRGHVGGTAAVGLAPIGVLPDRQRQGIGTALMHAVIAAADALDEPLVALVGEPDYYARFGFVAASTVGISAPDPTWGEYFQVRTLTAYRPDITGVFIYAPPFNDL